MKLPVLWRRDGVNLALRHQQDAADVILRHRAVFEDAAKKCVHPDFGRHISLNMDCLDRLDDVPLETRLIKTLVMLNQLYVIGSMTMKRVPDEPWTHLLRVILDQGWNASSRAPEQWASYLDYLAIMDNSQADRTGLADPLPRGVNSIVLQWDTIHDISASFVSEFHAQLFAIADEIGITGDQVRLKVGPVTVQLTEDALFLRRRAQERRALSLEDGSRNFFEAVMKIPYGGNSLWHLSISKTCHGQVYLFKRISEGKMDWHVCKNHDEEAIQ